MSINWNIVNAIFKRDLRLYFSNPTGYVFITLFIFMSAVAAFWGDRFFLNNLANLDQLNAIYPLLLLIFVPALTMGVWADERRQGTDELLLTLPATDLEIVLGKYFAVLGIYSAALVLSLSHVLVLFYLGSPDLGLMFGNFVGYWVIGAAFIATGMLASLLVTNATIAFILGALFMAGLVYIQNLGSIFGDSVEGWLSALSVYAPFGDFARGVISFSGLLYFFSIAGIMIYLNVILLGRRHWPAEADGIKMSQHQILRAVALAVGLIGINVIAGRANMRIDATAEQLHSLAPETYKLLEELSDERPVYIQAFISKEVPQSMVQTRENLVSFLTEIGNAGGSSVEVVINDTEPYSEDARIAREQFGILARELQESSGAGTESVPVFMGVAFTCGAEETVIPFFDRGLPTQYELMRSIRVVARTEKKKIGVLVNETKMFGGFDFNSGSTAQTWQVVGELEKQYEVVRIAANVPIDIEVDGLIAAMPSSLPQDEMDNLLTFIESGVPTLLLLDPLPAINLGISPSEKPGADRNPFMQNNQAPPKDKGNIEQFLSRLGLNFNKSQIVWDEYNPHPDFASIPREVVFVGRGNNNPMAFNPNEPVSADLQELVLLFPGFINKAGGSDLEFTPLVNSGFASGVQLYQNMVQRHFLFGAQLNTRGLPHYPTGTEYTLAAKITRQATAADSSGNGGRPALNIIAIADLDFVSEQFFEIRKQGLGNLNFDNVNFFLNCADFLAGDDSFIALRNRRVKHRTLDKIEGEMAQFVEKRTSEEQEADAGAQSALQEAQRRLTERVNEVSQRTDLDEQTKSIMSRNIQEVEQKKFDALQERINAEKAAKIAASKERMEGQIRGIQSGIKTGAVAFPPIPVIALGIYIFLLRRRREAEGAAAARRLRN